MKKKSGPALANRSYPIVLYIIYIFHFFLISEQELLIKRMSDFFSQYILLYVKYNMHCGDLKFNQINHESRLGKIIFYTEKCVSNFFRIRLHNNKKKMETSNNKKDSYNCIKHSEKTRCRTQWSIFLTKKSTISDRNVRPLELCFMIFAKFFLLTTDEKIF